MIPGLRQPRNTPTRTASFDHPATPGWPDRQGALLLRGIATAIVHLSEVPNPGTFALPYAPPVQQALDGVVLTCLLMKADPPESVPQLVEWCSTSTIDNLSFPVPPDLAPPGSRLVDRDTRQPTQICYELALSGVDPTAQQVGRQAMDDAAELCRDNDSPDTYRALRELLINRPVLTGRELATLPSDGTGLELLAAPLRDLYVSAPASHLDLDTRTYTACGHCRTLLHPTVDGELVCERDACRLRGTVKRGREYQADDNGGTHLLIRPLRQWVSGPGVLERQLAKRLQKYGAVVQLWPSYGTYGLHVRFPCGQSWAVEVKDWSSAALLGTSARPPAADPPYDRCFWAVPRIRLQADTGYQNRFRIHETSPSAARLELVGIDDLVRAARQQLAAVPDRHAPTEPPPPAEGLF
ncbi:hypothetical protein C7M71_016475 [Peterkaempfera bronchialis]|uniref:REase associating with pPIWI RE domain-containing protein n=1 Tax=Peterkaempfera bronchialis TaxID=2126346 RepID=A0A345SYH1_9ACTN|nr:hypothetical protein C7M71_016475 [Peterkaempfera bronchialis]